MRNDSTARSRCALQGVDGEDVRTILASEPCGFRPMEEPMRMEDMPIIEGIPIIEDMPYMAGEKSKSKRKKKRQRKKKEKKKKKKEQEQEKR